MPPPYSVATSLPTYDEAEKAKAAAMATSTVEVIPRVRTNAHTLVPKLFLWSVSFYLQVTNITSKCATSQLPPPSWLVRTKQVVVSSHRGSTRALSHVEMIVLMISEFYRLNELKEQLNLLEAFLGMFSTRFGTSKHHRSWSCSVHRVIVTWVIFLDLKHTNLPALTGK